MTGEASPERYGCSAAAARVIDQQQRHRQLKRNGSSPISAQVVLPAARLNTVLTYRDGLEGARLMPAVLSDNAIRAPG
jgi:hypothetical protein